MLVREQALYGTGFLPDTEQQIYRLPDDELYLAGTSEVALASLHAGEILAEGELPRRYAGFSSCFRREAGAAGRDTRGIFRVHQFDKVEMFSFTTAERSREEHELILATEEALLSELGLAYRVVNIAVDDLGASAAIKYDCEAWLPSQERYRELTSCSNTTDFQARRLEIRVRPAGGGRAAPRSHAQRDRGRRRAHDHRDPREPSARGPLGRDSAVPRAVRRARDDRAAPRRRSAAGGAAGARVARERAAGAGAPRARRSSKREARAIDRAPGERRSDAAALAQPRLRQLDHERRAAVRARCCACTLPPCASTIAATIARPSPAPARPRSRPPSARQNRSNTLSPAPSGRPGPWSRTSIRTTPSTGAAESSIGVPAGRVGERVAHQVREHLAQLGGVAADDRRRRSTATVDVAVTGAGARVVGGVAQQRLDRHRLEARLRHLVQAREGEQVLDEHAHPRGLLLDARHRLRRVLRAARRADAEELGIAADRGQRRAQLVRGVGEEAPQAVLARLALAEGALDLAEHRVEREAQAPDLGAGVRRADAAREIACGDRAGRRADAGERAQPEADQQPGEARRARARPRRSRSARRCAGA